MSLPRELIAAIVAELETDPELALQFAGAFAPYLSAQGTGGWIDAGSTVGYLGLSSLDALDRLVRDGLPCSQPHGPGGRRYFHRARLDAWMESR